MWALELAGYGFVQQFFIGTDPGGKSIFHNAPVVVFTLHFKNDAVATVVRHVYVKQAVGGARKHAKVEFAESVRYFYQLGEVNIFSEVEVHGCYLHPHSKNDAMFL